MLTIIRSKPLLCLLNIRHHWQPQVTEDGGQYERCTKCGKDRMEYRTVVDWNSRNKFGH
jgi:ribosomal protein S14